MHFGVKKTAVVRQAAWQPLQVCVPMPETKGVFCSKAATRQEICPAGGAQAASKNETVFLKRIAGKSFAGLQSRKS